MEGGGGANLIATGTRLEVEVRDVHLFEAEGAVHVVLEGGPRCQHGQGMRARVGGTDLEAVEHGGDAVEGGAGILQAVVTCATRERRVAASVTAVLLVCMVRVLLVRAVMMRVRGMTSCAGIASAAATAATRPGTRRRGRGRGRTEGRIRGRGCVAGYSRCGVGGDDGRGSPGRVIVRRRRRRVVRGGRVVDAQAGSRTRSVRGRPHPSSLSLSLGECFGGAGELRGWRQRIQRAAATPSPNLSLYSTCNSSIDQRIIHTMF